MNCTGFRAGVICRPTAIIFKNPKNEIFMGVKLAGKYMHVIPEVPRYYGNEDHYQQDLPKIYSGKLFLRNHRNRIFPANFTLAGKHARIGLIFSSFSSCYPTKGGSCIARNNLCVLVNQSHIEQLLIACKFRCNLVSMLLS